MSPFSRCTTQYHLYAMQYNILSYPKCHYNPPTGNIYEGKSWGNMHLHRSHTGDGENQSDSLTSHEYQQTQWTRYGFSTSQLWRTGQGNVKLLRKEPAAICLNLSFCCSSEDDWMKNYQRRISESRGKNILNTNSQFCCSQTHPREASSNNICFIYCSDQINYTYTTLPKVLAPLLMKGLTTLVISMSTNLNV